MIGKRNLTLTNRTTQSGPLREASDSGSLLNVVEQSDIVGAQTVDAEFEQGSRDLVGVDGPRHDTGAEFPRQLHEGSVDQRPMRPNVPGPDSVHALAKLLEGLGDAPIQ